MAEPSNWSHAVNRMPICPFCGDDSQIERRGPEWFCNTCGRPWLAFNENDRRLMKSLRITPER